MKSLMRLMLLIIALLSCWEILIRLFNIPNYLLPTPRSVFIALWHFRVLLFQATLTTLAEILLGLGLGILAGILFSLLLIFSPRLQSWFMPLLIMTQAIPIIAIAPLLVLWLGLGVLVKIILVFMMVFFAISSAFYDGLRRTPPELLELARLNHANRWNTIRYLRAPNALPHLASGIRIAATIAPLAAVVAEWGGSSRGLGYLLISSNANLQIDLLMADVLVIFILSYLLYVGVNWLLTKLIWWN